MIDTHRHSESQNYHFFKFQIQNKSQNTSTFNMTVSKGMNSSANNTNVLNYMNKATEKIKDKLQKKMTIQNTEHVISISSEKTLPPNMDFF